MSTIDQDITIKQTLEYSLNKETSDIGIYYGKTGTASATSCRRQVDRNKDY